MAKRDDDLVGLLKRLPWWLNLLLAPVVYVLLSEVAPGFLADHPLLLAVAPLLTPLGMFFGGVLVLVAGFSFFAAKRKRLLLERQTGLDSIRALAWREFEERGQTRAGPAASWARSRRSGVL